MITDVILPRLDGLRAIGQLKCNLPGFEKTPVIFISGTVKDENLYNALKTEKSPIDFLPKPFTPGEIRTLVKKFLK